jgi:two-component system alkaline phosphatase synthesis response regulator PhoP
MNEAILMPTTCMIVAHDPWTIQLIRIFTKETGFNTIQAFEGNTALQIARNNPLDLIILEYILPGEMRGWELLQCLKSDPITCKYPVVVLSWHGHEATDRIGEDSKVSFLQDPVSYDDFIHCLKKMGVKISLPEGTQNIP